MTDRGPKTLNRLLGESARKRRADCDSHGLNVLSDHCCV